MADGWVRKAGELLGRFDTGSCPACDAYAACRRSTDHEHGPVFEDRIGVHLGTPGARCAMSCTRTEAQAPVSMNG